jgi:hypothetical protein
MITKEFVLIAMKSLRQEQSLRDHDTAVEAGYVSNPKYPDLIPPELLGPARWSAFTRFGQPVPNVPE